VLAALVGLVTIDAGFVFDDASALLASPVVTGDTPWWLAWQRDFWGRPIGDGVNTWRPVMPMIWALLWKGFPSQALPFHTLSVALHVLATALAMRLAARLRAAQGWAITVGTLFAVHPLNTEAVSAIVAQADLLSFSLVLWACSWALGQAGAARGLGCAAVLLLAAAVKESALIFAPLVVLLFAVQPTGWRARVLGATPTVAVAVAVAAFQLALPRRATVGLWGNTLAHEVEGVGRALLGFYTVGRSLMMSFWPHPLAPSHGYAAIEPQPEALLPFALLGLALLVVGIGAGVWAIRAGRRDWIAALAFLYAPALLQSHWFVPLVTDLAERLLYPATLGAAMVVASGIFAWLPRARVRWVAVAGLTLSALLVSFAPRRAWVSELALWSHGVRVEPKAMRHQYNLSSALLEHDRLDHAAFHRVLAIYLVNRFPERAEWDRVVAVERLPVPERFVELPAALYPDAPCPVVVAFLRQNEHLPSLHRHALVRWKARYPDCFSGTSARAPDPSREPSATD